MSTHVDSEAVGHFKLYFYAAVLHVLERTASVLGSVEEAFAQFPFLVGYNNEIAGYGLAGVASSDASSWWRSHLRDWEQRASGHLPLRALREAAALEHAEMTQLLAIGLVEEDARFGLLFESLQGTRGLPRPTHGLLSAWWSGPDGAAEGRAGVKRLSELGLIQVINPGAPRCEWAFHIPSPLWDAMLGDPDGDLAGWLRHRAAERLPELDEVLIAEATRRELHALRELLADGEMATVIVRGAPHNGRRTLLGAIARSVGRSLLQVSGLSQADDPRWKLVGPLATLRGALPVVVLDPAPGETVKLPELGTYRGPLAIVLGKAGSVAGPRAERAVTVTLALPDVDTRVEHWRAALGPDGSDEAGAIGERFRMTSGNIRRGAALASSYAALASRPKVSLADVRAASRALSRETLDALAVRLETSGDWSQLAVAPQTLTELADLEQRCRNRERLHARVGGALAAHLDVGVRALFSGPSGTGKTMAACVLASVLGLDIYRLELSSVVNKYIGETEKNLECVLSRAEEMNVILLLDEGDALLTQRTSVHSSNDRYANLETNFLLQRLESFEGILIVTTNAGDRIDSAFHRRLEVVVEFRPPDAAERWVIWQLHLPPAHAIDHRLLSDVARRCTLTGGQIRNAVLHASARALDDGGAVSSAHLEEAVLREYQKAGATYPLRTTRTRLPG